MESSDPFAPGFGEFQGIPNRTLPDDCMEYAVFVVADSINAKTRLEEVKKATEELAAKWSEGYIWQREGFSLELVENKELKMWSLQGRTEYGDSVEDEWYIVWMLRELSKKFADLWIRYGQALCFRWIKRMLVLIFGLGSTIRTANFYSSKLPTHSQNG